MADNKKTRITEIRNRRVEYEFNLLNLFEAGLELTGTEVKSLREGHANINFAYCFFKNGELQVKNIYISEYDLGTYNNHDPRRPRRLLLRKAEL